MFGILVEVVKHQVHPCELNKLMVILFPPCSDLRRNGKKKKKTRNRTWAKFFLLVFEGSHMHKSATWWSFSPTNFNTTTIIMKLVHALLSIYINWWEDFVGTGTCSKTIFKIAFKENNRKDTFENLSPHLFSIYRHTIHISFVNSKSLFFVPWISG